MIDGIISYLAYARCITFPNRQTLQGHTHCPRWHHEAEPIVVRRMDSSLLLYPIAMDGHSSRLHMDMAYIPHTSDHPAIPIVA